MQSTIWPERANAATRCFPSPSHLLKMYRVLRALWRGVREWCDDAAYESYLRSKAAKNNHSEKLTATEFYVDQMNRRYSRPNRCC